MTEGGEFWFDTDCCRAVAKVYETIFGYNPVSDTWPNLSGERQITRYVILSGGLEKMLDDNLLHKGFHKQSEPEVASVVILDSAFIGIYLGDNKSASKTSEGLLITGATVTSSYQNKRDYNLWLTRSPYLQPL